MRLLITILLPPEIESEVAKLKEKYYPEVPSKNNIRPHLTLLPPLEFAGNPKDLDRALTKVAGNAHSFNLQIDGIGKFGSRVVYLRVFVDENLLTFYHNLTANLGQLVDLDRIDGQNFQPHITFANKLYPDEQRKILTELAGYQPKFNFEVRAIHLFKFNFFNHHWQQIKSFSLQNAKS